MTEEPKYKIGDPVWSKMKGYCPWPSRIAAPYESSLKNTAAEKQKVAKINYLVFFFGSNNFAWMPEDTIKPYAEFKEKNKSGGKTQSFKAGLKAIEDYIATDGQAKLLEDYNSYLNNQNNTTSAIKNNASNSNIDSSNSPSPSDESLNNDSNHDGDQLPSIDDELETIKTKRPAPVSPKKQNFDSHNSDSLSSPTTPTSVQRDYSRTPFKTKSKTAVRGDEPSSEIASPTKRVKTNDYDPLVSSSLTTGSTTSPHSKPPVGGKLGARSVLLRATAINDELGIDKPEVVMEEAPARLKEIRPSGLRFGFIGLGFLGGRMCRNLISSGHKVYMYNRSISKLKWYEDIGGKKVNCPADVMESSDIVFSCLSGPDATKEVIFGTYGLLTKMDSSKAYVELSSIDPQLSRDIHEAITERGGRYLEAPPISQGKDAADGGELVFLAAGDRLLYNELKSCFQAMGKSSFFISHEVGSATKMNPIISTLYGNIVGAVSECCALVERHQFPLKTLQEVLKLSVMDSPLIRSLMEKIINNDQEVVMPINQLQKSLRLALGIAEDIEQACPITAITNEMFKQTKKSGYSESDVVSVYLKSRF